MNNFEDFRLAVTREALPSHVPIGENDIPITVIEEFMGHQINDIPTYVSFWQKAGYDYVLSEVRGQFIADSFQVKIAEGVKEMPERPKSVSTFETGCVKNEETFNQYPWIGPQDAYYKDMDLIGQNLPDGMKVMLCHGPLFNGMMRIMGLETMCMAIFENPGLIKAVAEKIGELAVNIVECALQRDFVGGLWLGDDMAYSTSLMVSPDFMREYIFPYYKRIGDICKRHNKLFVFHSDGLLADVFDDLIACGVQAVHPNEPQSVDIVELKKRVGNKAALIGNVDVDLLTRGSKDDVIKATRNLIDNVAPGGGFVLGSGNSIADYIPIENYKAMLDTVKEFGNIY